MQTVETERLELDAGDRLLDVGCGDGRHLRAVIGHRDVHAVGTDKSRDQIREAFRRLWIYPLIGTGSLALSDVIRLPFAGGSFDAVICAEVLEHLDDYRAALKEALRVLRPGGILGISVPHAFPERVCWSLDPRYPEMTGHKQIIDVDELCSEVERLGARCVGGTKAHAFHTPLWWTACLTRDFRLAHHPEGIPEWVMQPWSESSLDLSILWDWLKGGENHPSRFVSAYLKFLAWYEAHQPRLLTWIERRLNPWIGYSEVLYCRKRDRGPDAGV